MWSPGLVAHLAGASLGRAPPEWRAEWEDITVNVIQVEIQVSILWQHDGANALLIDPTQSFFDPLNCFQWQNLSWCVH